mmetsp:Transcript_9531/g.15834  ORF Transcript_9531/g.15834 Transcript_9531/m.15834 type:complete len:142 (-) Transcript_9531:3-428(-)
MPNYNQYYLCSASATRNDLSLSLFQSLHSFSYLTRCFLPSFKYWELPQLVGITEGRGGAGAARDGEGGAGGGAREGGIGGGAVEGTGGGARGLEAGVLLLVVFPPASDPPPPPPPPARRGGGGAGLVGGAGAAAAASEGAF